MACPEVRCPLSPVRGRIPGVLPPPHLRGGVRGWAICPPQLLCWPSLATRVVSRISSSAQILHEAARLPCADSPIHRRATMRPGICADCTKRDRCRYRQPGTWVFECEEFEERPASVQADFMREGPEEQPAHRAGHRAVRIVVRCASSGQFRGRDVGDRIRRRRSGHERGDCRRHRRECDWMRRAAR